MNTAPVKWAQRKDSLYVTITLPDVKDHKVDLTDNKLVFEGVSGDKKYSLNLEFFKDIVAEGSVWNVLPSSVHMKLNKKDVDDEFWPRLLKDKAQEKTNVKIDWDRYVDEDEAEGKDFDMSNLDGGNDFGGMDFSKMGDMMGGMGGMGGMPGMMGGMGGMPGMMGGMGGMPGMMGGMGGMPGMMGGMGDDDEEDLPDSDDEDGQLPDLESTDA